MYLIPNDFVWGVSTSSYQIEGSVQEGGRGESIWDRFCGIKGHIVDGSSGEPACDHYRLYQDDVKLISELGVKAYRFSMAWPRVQPNGYGRFNTEGLHFYSRLVDSLLEHGIVPWLCLNHWDLPQALQERGGWTNRDTAWRFVEYSLKVMEELSDRVKQVIAHNEANVMAVLGYGIGVHAPGIRDASACFAATHHLNLSQGMATKELKNCSADLQIGPVLSLQPVVEKDINSDASERLDAIWNRMFLDPVLLGNYPELLQEELKPWIKEGDIEMIHLDPDFFGLNHYTVMRATCDANEPLGVRITKTPQGVPITDSGWEIRPRALLEQLLELKERYKNLPVYITENGCACNDQPDGLGTVKDPSRVAYLRNYLEAGQEALSQGVDLRGWFFCSLLDNFEWAEGYTKRFGLVYVDFPTQKRIRKQSFHFVQKLIQRNAIPDS